MSMLHADQLWQQHTCGNRNCSRGLVVAYLKAAVAEARQVPLDELAQRNTSGHFGGLDGERIAGGMSTVIAMQAWINDESAPDLEEVLEILSPLDSTATDDKKLWLELFEKVDQLKPVTQNHTLRNPSSTRSSVSVLGTSA